MAGAPPFAHRQIGHKPAGHGCRKPPHRGALGAWSQLHQARPVSGDPARYRRRQSGPSNCGRLQDRLPPFSMEEARAAIAANLGADVEALFAEFGPPVAAASIAQVHRARTTEGRDVAVKILRPGIEKRFAADLASFFFAARLARARQRRRRGACARSLRWRRSAQSMKLELDLRMEASAIAEMAHNIAGRSGLPRAESRLAAHRPPGAHHRMDRRHADFRYRGPRGQRLRSRGARRHRHPDASCAMRSATASFMPTCIREISSSMTQGNLVAVDFGIMGRLSAKERLFLAEILFGFITRDYMRVSLRCISMRAMCRAHQDRGQFRPGAARDRRADHGPAGAAKFPWRGS